MPIPLSNPIANYTTNFTTLKKNRSIVISTDNIVNRPRKRTVKFTNNKPPEGYYKDLNKGKLLGQSYFTDYLTTTDQP